MSPQDICHPIIGEETWAGYQGTDEMDSDIVITSLLLLYQIIRMPPSPMLAKNISSLTNRFRELYGKPPFYKTTIVKAEISMLDNDLNFRKIIASYDMFFNKFPNHDKSRMRIGTSLSRWRDCTAFKVIFETQRILGIAHLVDFVPWIWEGAIVEDLDRLFGRPFSNPGSSHGYFFYASDFGLVSKSAYSVTINPASYIFNHVIYCTLGNQRGINARMVQPPALPFIIKNALCVAFSFSFSCNWYLGLDRTEIMKDIERINRHKKENPRKKCPMPTSQDPLAWLVYWKTVRHNQPSEFKDFLRTVRVFCKESLPNTVGRYLFEFLRF